MDCPACGAAARPGDRFCRRCGRPLTEGEPLRHGPLAVASGAPPAVPPAPSPAGPPAADPPAASPVPPQTYPFASLPAPPPAGRRASPLRAPTLALLAVALVLFLAATNPPPSAYVAWAAARLAPAATFVPARDAAYFAVERATVAESYGICTVYQTSLRGGTMTVLGIVGHFLTIGGQPAALPAPVRPRRRRHNGMGSVQI